MDSIPSGPKLLIHVPERLRVVETLGWQPGIWGAFFLLVAVFSADVAARSSAAVEWAIFLSSSTLGPGLAGYEVRRRRNRTAFVKDGDHIAVFRKGRLDLVLAPGEIARVKADLIIMIKIGVPLSLAAALFTSVGFLVVTRDKAVNEGLMILSLGIACWASLASAAWTRFRCVHLRVPIKGSKWTEESVLIPRSRIQELFIDIKTLEER
jgi:hypothetical protein